MLVADAFDAMGSKSVLEQGWALQRFTGDNLTVGEQFFQVVTAGDRPG